MWKTRPRLRRVLVAVLALLVAQELVLRALFPLPEFADLDRTDYGAAAAAGAGPGGLRYASLEWASGPDGTAHVHTLNGYGFRDEAWSQSGKSTDPGRHKRVLFVGDSFVEGAMAGQDASIPAVYAELGRGSVDVMNAGLVGTGPAEYARVLGDLVPRYRPDRVHLVLYANDLPLGAIDAPRASGEARRFARGAPRLAVLLGLRAKGEALPYAFARTRSFLPVVPDPANPWTARSAVLEPHVEPRYADAMRAGELNPYLVNLLARESQELRLPPGDVHGFVSGVRDFVRAHGAELFITYVPSRHQTTTHYVRYARQLARTLPPTTDLTGREYRSHAAALAEACRALDVAFLDVTDAIAEREAAGDHVYWRYDDHMREAGYRFVAERIAAFESAD